MYLVRPSRREQRDLARRLVAPDAEASIGAFHGHDMVVVRGSPQDSQCRAKGISGGAARETRHPLPSMDLEAHHTFEHLVPHPSTRVVGVEITLEGHELGLVAAAQDDGRR